MVMPMEMEIQEIAMVNSMETKTKEMPTVMEMEI